ncbi:MAG: argininosuccinate lyase [Xanthomonadales bacterium]|nr:argininosuccinate lyase [Xanthomonadales bacterium]
MKKFLWQSEVGVSVDEAILEFTAGEDIMLDRELFAYDIRATAAHVHGLARIGILDGKEAEILDELLDALLLDFESGEFVLDERYEDGHSAIEFYLTERASELGPKVHTGRSRNDQVAVATRLYLKDQLQALVSIAAEIASACLRRAESGAMVPMPGYTHLQRAVPSSVGLWMAAFAEAFTDDAAFAQGVRALVDCSPLGTAAGYGVNLALDRDGVADELGFTRLQVNPMYAQNSRGKFEVMALQAALHAMQDLRRLAWDLSLFTTTEFNFVSLPPQYTTGSSIMPNKSNPDVIELLRGRVATVEAAVLEIQSTLSLPSGYQRDLQLTKAPLLRGMRAALQALRLVPALIEGVTFNEVNMRDAISREMYATDLTLERAAAGVPFRSAYRQAKTDLGELAAPDPVASIAKRVSPGACGDLQLERIRSRLAELRTTGGTFP